MKVSPQWQSSNSPRAVLGHETTGERPFFFLNRSFVSASLAVVLFLGAARLSLAFDIVKDGKPVATIVSLTPPASSDKPKKTTGRKQAADSPGEGAAVKLLQEWIAKITDVELAVKGNPPPGPAIYVGKAALAAGLKLDDLQSPTCEGVRIVIEDDRILIAGQSDAATLKAVARFLELLGCRYFMDGPLGEVFPRTKDLAVGKTQIAEMPGLLMRNPKGPTWNAALWKAWNGGGGEMIAHAHSWGGYVKESLFAQHPDWFAMDKAGQRHAGGWLCTSNPELRKYFAQQVIEAIKAGRRNPSLSPTDGRGYCQCPQCKAQDDPGVIEESSGTVSVSRRYVDFFDDVARQVAKVYPDSILSFYCYADYTQPPKLDHKLWPNLCAFIAPIRYCRLHEIGNPDCPSRLQEMEMIEGWAKLADKIGYYNYMYNLADATLPTFKFTACKKEFPYLKDHGLSAMTIEVLSNWHIYGPQIYLSLRMAYAPKADADAIMEDYYTKFYGPAAAPMKEYWLGIDAAQDHCKSHAGSFFGLQEIYTPLFLKECDQRLARAAKAAQGQKVFADRVALHTEGFKSAVEYQQIRRLMAQGDFAKAKETLESLEKRIGQLEEKHWANREYGTSYLDRFLKKNVLAGSAATAAPAKLLAVLPEKWRFISDDGNKGLEQHFAEANFDDSRWGLVSTYDQSLSSQGLSGNTIFWYRTRIEVPASHGRLKLFFAEVDGFSDVFVNGTRIPIASSVATGKGKAKAISPEHDGQGRPRLPFDLDITSAVHPGSNTIAVRVDHTRMTDLFLGGILRPVLLIDQPDE